MAKSRSKVILSGLNDRSIVLLGMMGCGKSAIGKMIARRLRLEFKDADFEIEKAADRSIPDIFEEYGEEEFRRLETRVIDRVLSEGPVLLALGGGAFMAPETRTAVASSALSIWLKADIDLLVERVGRKPGKRPLLANGNPREILTSLLKEREPVYKLADLHVQSVGGTKSQMRDNVLNELHNYLLSELTESQV